MSEENKTEVSEQKPCLCQNKYFKKFLVVALGSFVGVYLALNLFAFCHKPPYPYGGFGNPQGFNCPCKKFKHRQFKESNMRPDFEKPSRRPNPNDNGDLD